MPLCSIPEAPADVLARPPLSRLNTDCKFAKSRPRSQYTDFDDTDDEVVFDPIAYQQTDFEDESPTESSDLVGLRQPQSLSMYSQLIQILQSRRRSDTTISTPDEALTPPPHSSSGPYGMRKSLQAIQGPTGPHLFQQTLGLPKPLFYDTTLQMSPLFPKASPDRFCPQTSKSSGPDSPELPPQQATTAGTESPVSGSGVHHWSTVQVALWLGQTGIDDVTARKFVENDITGSVLLNLDFDDLKELEIRSLGKRHRIWNQIGALRCDQDPHATDGNGGSRRRRPGFDTRSPEVSSRGCVDRPRDTPSTGVESQTLDSWIGSRREPLTPGDSISIVAIEEIVPKPHWCSKGQECKTFKKRQRTIERMNVDYCTSLNAAALLARTASPSAVRQARLEPLDLHGGPDDEPLPRDPSLVGSSDALGPTRPVNLVIQERCLDRLERTDAQDIVKQYLTLQHMTDTDPFESSALGDEAGLELFPERSVVLTPSHEVATLPRPIGFPRSASAGASPSLSRQPSSAWPSMLRRRGTPASDSHVPLGALATPAIAREESHSVPPDMHYRSPVLLKPDARRTRPWRRASLQLSPVLESACDEIDAGRRSVGARDDGREPPDMSGWMRKRKNKMLRHEWIRQHARLSGTQLALHATAQARDVKPLETVDVKEYDVELIGRVGESRLNAALSTLR